MQFGRETVESGAQFVGPAALGVAVGLLLADRMTRGGREIASMVCLTVGLTAAAPFLARQIHRQINAPGTNRGSRRIQAALRSGEFFENVAAEDVERAS
ncbi:MAG TPA: hypothetical protein VMN36_03340 [Verrucomicrobiales bacterium]|nr:hypothetical protein [Verrucomicrobiales bacterium]